MRRVFVFVLALMTVFAMPVVSEARGHHGGGHHGGGHHFHGGGGRHFHGGGRHWGGGGRHWRGGRHWHGGGHWRGHRRYWHGRWWAYGVGSCWRWSPYYDRFVWVCY